MLNISLNAFNQSTATPPLTASTQDSSLPEPVITLLNDNTKLEAPYSLTTLQTQLQQQKAALNSTSSHQSSIDLNISDSLLDAIELSSQHLEHYQAWTEGGSQVIAPIIDLMYESILNDTNNTQKNEDLMQLMVFDILLNEQNYGIDINSLNDNGNGINAKKYFGYITENFGSGMHNEYQGKDADNPSKIVNWFLNTVVTTLDGKVPEHSIANKVIQHFKNDSNKEALLHQPYDIKDSISHSSSTSTQISPALKFFFLGQGAAEGLISSENWNNVITGNIDDIKSILNLNTNQDLAKWLVKQDIGWTLDSKGQLDYNKGNDGGIPVSKLIEFFGKFPSRILTDEEMKDINRIGDNVKMIQQTLKYWYQIMRDERVAIARNI